MTQNYTIMTAGGKLFCAALCGSLRIKTEQRDANP
jgi:hypothetical protein